MIKIYTLSHPTTKEIRYVGFTKTKLSERLTKHIRDAKNRNSNHRTNWINSLDSFPIIEEVDNCIDEDKEWLEVMYIALFKSWGFRLVNATDGGEGGDTWSGRSIESRMISSKRISDALAGKKKPPRTEEHKVNLRKHLDNYNGKIQRGEIKHPTKGVKHSDERREATSKRRAGVTMKTWVSMHGPIYQIDIVTGEIIKMFENPGYAARELGKMTGNIVKALRGEISQSCGFKWRFVN